MKSVLLFLFLLASSLSLKMTSVYYLQHLGQFDLETFRQAQLAKHNQLRKKHGCPPLELYQSLNQLALAHSQQMLSTKSLSDSYYAQNDYLGENLYSGWGSPTFRYQLGDASQGWYDEIQDYDFETFSSKNENAVEDFTSMIWKSATLVGFGYAIGQENDGYAIYITANYHPVTNVIGQYEQNVPKPL